MMLSRLWNVNGTAYSPWMFRFDRRWHSAPWKSTYAATRFYSGPIKFVLTGGPYGWRDQPTGQQIWALDER